MAETAAVILTLGEHSSYQRILSDLLAQGMAPESICVVHNPVAPADQSPETPPGVEVLRMPGNVGYAEGMNAGMRYQLTRGAVWIWLLTDDVRLRPGTLQAMVKGAAARPDTGALGPRLLQSGTSTVFSLGGERTRWGHPYNAGYGIPFEQLPGDAVPLRKCAWLDGSSIMLRAGALRAVGLYDPSLFSYTEDCDLCLRLEQAGWTVAVVESAVAEQSAGYVRRPGPVGFLLARNGLRYAYKAVGRSAVMPELRWHLRGSIHLLRLAITGPRRRTSLVYLFATWLGIGAFFLRHTGFPPPWLPGRGDIG
jgi:GT2 family glycosyltransferase